jgi:hypothetical protein
MVLFAFSLFYTTRRIVIFCEICMKSVGLKFEGVCDTPRIKTKLFAKYQNLKVVICEILLHNEDLGCEAVYRYCEQTESS